MVWDGGRASTILVSYFYISSNNSNVQSELRSPARYKKCTSYSERNIKYIKYQT